MINIVLTKVNIVKLCKLLTLLFAQKGIRKVSCGLFHCVLLAETGDLYFIDREDYKVCINTKCVVRVCMSVIVRVCEWALSCACL